MTHRDWTASSLDFAALARLNTVQYPDAPLTAQGVERNWGFVDPGRPTLIRFAVHGGQEVALIETYPSHGDVFLLELIAPGDSLERDGPELLAHAREWAERHGARRWELTLRGSDPRAKWLERQGFELRSSSTEWTHREGARPAPLPDVILRSVWDDPVLQEVLRTTLNVAREELQVWPFSPEQFRDDVLNFGVYRPDLLWLAQTPAGETAGFTCLHVWETGEHGEFSWVWVTPTRRRSGIGTALLAHACREAQLPHISANLPGPQAGLRGLLEKAGFQQSGEWLTAALALT